MTEDTKKPPAGMLAEQELAEPVTIAAAEPEKPTQAIVDTPSNATPDPNYLEPPSLEKFKLTHNEISKSWSQHHDYQQTSTERAVLIGFLLSRVEALEAALLPFSVTALVMSNARMCLISDGRPTEPAGGTWVSNPPQGIQLQPNEGIFFNACDVYGRGRTQEHMADTFKRLQEAQKQQGEKDKHVEDGGTVH